MNFKHLHYFWVTAKAGGIMRAGEQLHTTPQTLSGQIKLLEDWLGRKLFQKSGRNLELTEDGRLALGYADQIFTLGAELENAVRLPRGTNRVLDFKVGVADSVTKSLAYRLLEPALTLDEPVRMICSEGKFPDLLAKLALNQLDLVIADEPMSKRMSVKAFNHELGSTPISTAELERARTRWLNRWEQQFADAEQVGLALSESVAQGDWRLFFQLRDRVKALGLA
ncbi:MAG: LysR family transcriptional regulator, partial [Betaproteobacteria bacterium]|nr:LysR family transcriptional regulator [Betaproteobacteria bacterium]